MESKLEPVQEILLPIDIHYNKLLDWLINRRHCKQEWQASILEVREKISTAITDMPAVPEITSLIKGSHINYFHCRRIVELLKSTDGAKNMFGRYSSQRMKDWQEILKLYETDDLYLAEVAQLLARNVNYEVPILKKQIVDCLKTQKDCSKKEADYGTIGAEYREKYATMCKQMGIEGKKIKTELAELVADLPNIYSGYAEESRGLKKSVDYYSAFVAFTGDSDVNEKDLLPMLRHVQTHGNTTSYQYETGNIPTVVEEEVFKIDTSSDSAAEVNEDIDWGDIAYDPADTSLDIDYDLGDITIEDGGIGMECSGDAHDISASIDFDDDEIIVKGSQHAEKENDKAVRVDDGIARGRLAKSILDNTETRNIFLDDLMELESFLSQREAELRSDENVVSTYQLSSAPESCHADVETVTAMLEGVRKLLNKFTSVRMQHLILIRNAPRYVDRLEENLKQTLVVSDKMAFYQKQCVEKRIEAGKEIDKIHPKKDILVKKTRVLQKQIEGEISKRYKNRHVNIMGEINNI